MFRTSRCFGFCFIFGLLVLLSSAAHAYQAPFITTAEMRFRFCDTRAVVRGSGAPEIFFYPNIRSVSVGGKALGVVARGPHWLQVALPEGEGEVTVAGDAEAPMAGPVCVSPAWKAKGRVVSSAEELRDAAKAAKPGDTIYVKNGAYADWRLRIEAQGEEGRAVTIRPETPGGVVFRLKTSIEIRGDWVEFREFRFDHADMKTLAIVRGDHNRVSQCHFYSSGRPTSTFGHVTNLREGADRNVVAHCYWTRSKCMSLGISTPGTQPDQSVATDNVFFNNVFRDIERYWINGQENIQLCSGGPRSEAARPRTTIEGNLFDWAWGDGEIISNKSSENFIRYNVFAHCPRSALVLRGGDDVVVEGNVLIDTHYGIRMFGRRHRIVNNLIVGSRGAAFFVRPHSGGTQTADVLIAHNTVVDCGSGISAGTGEFKEGDKRIPNRVVNNIFSTGRGTIVRPDLASEMAMDNNILHAVGAAMAGYEGENAIQRDPKIEGAGIAMRPGKGSPAIDAAKAIDVDRDRWGTKRPQGKASDIGADEWAERRATRRMPDVPEAREWSVEWFKLDPHMIWDAKNPLARWGEKAGATAGDGELRVTDGGAELSNPMPEDFVMEWRYNPVAFASKASVVFRRGEDGSGYRLTFGGAEAKDGKPSGYFTFEKNGVVVARCTDTVFFRPNYIPYFPNRMVAIDREEPNPEAWYHARLLVAGNRVRLILNRSGRQSEGDPGNMGDVTVLLWEDTADIAGSVPEGRGLRIEQSGAGRWRDFYVWEYGDVRKEMPKAPKGLKATPHGARVRLAWESGAPGRAGVFYEVERDGARAAAQVGATAWDDFDAKAESGHRYRVRSRTTWGRASDWVETSVRTGAPKRVFLVVDAANHSAIEAPMAVMTHEETGRQFVGTAPGTGRFMKEPPEKGYVDYEFSAPQEGRYNLWGNVISPSKSHDSFWLMLPGAEKVKQYYTGNPSTWGWTQAARGVTLTKGTHRFRFLPREDDTKMSRLLLTDDLGWRPVGGR